MNTKFCSPRPPETAIVYIEHPTAPSLIADPLWEHVCAESVSLMGPIALQISKAHLGEFSVFDRAVDLYCDTEEVSCFLKKYHFIVLGSLQRYFPALRKINVQINSYRPKLSA